MAGDVKPTIISEAIGLRIKKLCAERYDSKSDCAREFGVKPQNWGRIEAGKMKFDPDEIYRFSAFFGVDPGWLLTGRGAESRDVPPPVRPSVTNPNVVRVLDPEPINLIFRLQQVVAEIGQHVAVGKTLADFPEKNQLKAIIRRILERIEDDAPQSEIPDQNSPADQDSNVILPESRSHGNTA